MNILLSLKHINNDFIFFGDPIKNSIIENGTFTRLIYSDHFMTLNGMYIWFDSIELSQREMIEILIELEKTILFKIDVVHKNAQYKIREYLKHLTAKSLDEFKLNKCILKISGIWETKIEYGITFKFLELNS
jgi:hypothetical protein